MKYLLLILILFPLDAHAYTTEDILKSVNRERYQPLVVNEKLVRAAQEKASALVRCSCFSHVVDGRKAYPLILAQGYSYSVAGENLAVGYKDANNLIKAWMNSPSHRYNITYPFRETGIAMANGKLNGKDVTFVVQLFANPR